MASSAVSSEAQTSIPEHFLQDYQSALCDLGNEQSRKTMLEDPFSVRIYELDHILEIGPVTEIWAKAVAVEHPSATISSLREDMYDTLDGAANLDVVHCRRLRMPSGPKRLFMQTFAALRLGGRFEIQEMTPHPVDGDAVKATHLQDTMKASGIFQKWMKEAGFSDVDEITCDIELEGLEEYMNDLGWPKDKLDVRLALVNEELASSGVNASCRWTRVSGQKLHTQTPFTFPLFNNHLQLAFREAPKADTIRQRRMMKQTCSRLRTSSTADSDPDTLPKRCQETMSSVLVPQSYHAGKATDDSKGHDTRQGMIDRQRRE